MKQFLNNNKEIIIILLFFAFLIGMCVFSSIQSAKNLYASLQNDIDNNLWSSAKEKVEQLGDYKDCSSLTPNIYYHYYLQVGDEQYANKNFDNALENYKKAKQYKSSEKDVDKKIKNAEVQIEKERIRVEQERIKAEREERLKTQRMLDNVVILNQRFGYTQYGEKAVVGKIKNKNSFSVQVRADIDLKDSRGNVIGTTYTYDKIAPNSVWNFEAPTFNVNASNMYLNLTIDELD